MTPVTGEMTAEVGLLLAHEVPPEQAPPLGARAEATGFTEIWISEDFFTAGGIATAASVLAGTQRIPVGLGVVSALTRHPALLAMEVASLCRLHPGRFRPGIGLGVPTSLNDLGLLPRSPLQAVTKYVSTLRSVLTREDALDPSGIHLLYPPPDDPPIYVAAIGPRMLELSGALADGTLLSVLSHPTYVRWARRMIDRGREGADRGVDDHKVTVFALYSPGNDRDRAMEIARHHIALHLGFGRSAITDEYGISAALEDMLATGDRTVLAGKMPDAWVENLAVVGSPAQCAERVGQLIEAGADSVALLPIPGDDTGRILEFTARRVLPLL